METTYRSQLWSDASTCASSLNIFDAHFVNFRTRFWGSVQLRRQPAVVGTDVPRPILFVPGGCPTPTGRFGGERVRYTFCSSRVARLKKSSAP
jgi:hypothetical protein